MFKAAEDVREGAGEIGALEIEGDDGAGDGVANDAVPFAWRFIERIPAGENGIWVIEAELGRQKV